jgi:twinkle protein
MAGIFVLAPGTLAAFLRERRMPRGLECGIRDLDEVARLPAGQGWLTVVTGIPSHGKSHMLRVWLAYQAMRHRLGIVWCSPEDNRPEILALHLAQIIAGQPMQEAGTYIPEAVLREAERWIETHITFLYADDPDTEMTLEWVLQKAEVAKQQRRRSLLVIDPWNEVEHAYDWRKESETQYTGRWLRKLKAWGRAHGFSLVVAAHPRQQVPDAKTKRYPVVDGYAISGSANWYNRADLGLTIYRREEGFMEVHCWKARFPGFGKRDGVAKLALQKRSQRLASTSHREQQEGDMIEDELPRADGARR